MITKQRFLPSGSFDVDLEELAASMVEVAIKDSRPEGMSATEMLDAVQVQCNAEGVPFPFRDMANAACKYFSGLMKTETAGPDWIYVIPSMTINRDILELRITGRVDSLAVRARG